MSQASSYTLNSFWKFHLRKAMKSLNKFFLEYLFKYLQLHLYFMLSSYILRSVAELRLLIFLHHAFSSCFEQQNFPVNYPNNQEQREHGPEGETSQVAVTTYDTL